MGKGKIKVEIIAPGKAYKKTCKVEGGRIIIKAGGLGRGDEKWTPPYREERTVPDGLFKTGKKVFYQEGADETLPLTPEGERPLYTIRDITKAGGAKIVSEQAKVGSVTMPIQIALLVMMGFSMLGLWLIMVRLGIINVG